MRWSPPPPQTWNRQVLSQNNYATIRTHWFKLETAHSDEEGRLEGRARDGARLVDNEPEIPQMRPRGQIWCRNVTHRQQKRPFPVPDHFKSNRPSLRGTRKRVESPPGTREDRTSKPTPERDGSGIFAQMRCGHCGGKRAETEHC